MKNTHILRECLEVTGNNYQPRAHVTPSNSPKRLNLGT